MSDMFDKHLNNLLFIQGAEKCETLDEKVQFCKDFLATNDKTPPKPPIQQGSYADNFMQNPITNLIPLTKNGTKRFEAKTRISEYYVAVEPCRKAATRDLYDELFHQMLNSGCIEITEYKDSHTMERIIVATVEAVIR